jgi:hypothetical protein
VELIKECNRYEGRSEKEKVGAPLLPAVKLTFSTRINPFLFPAAILQVPHSNRSRSRHPLPTPIHSSQQIGFLSDDSGRAVIRWFA